MNKYMKLEHVIHAIAENMAQAANLKEHCNEPTFCAGEFLVEAEMLVGNLPTIEVNDGEWLKDEYDISHCSECGCINNFELNKPTWIPVNERLPDEDEEVLVTVYFKGTKTRYSTGYVDYIKPCYYVDIAKHIGGDWLSMSDEYKVSLHRHVVIAWKPLPEPYKESEE